MKRNKLWAFTLAIVVSILCISTPLNSGAINSEEETSSASLADTAVLVSESDLVYDLIPASKPNRAVLKAYTGKQTRIILPETLGGYPLSNFTTAVFDEAQKLEYIKFPSSATSVNAKMFKGTSSLKYIDVSENNPTLISVDGVVYNKSMTTLFAFPNGVGGSYTIPDTVKLINQFAFYQCTFLTEIFMPNSVESVSVEAFSHCHNLSNVRMSDNLSSIDDRAFSYCDELKSLDLPYSLSYIGTDAFLGHITSDTNHRVYYLTDGLYYVDGSYAQEYVNKLHLPNEVKHLVDRKITDYKTGVTIIDPAKALPNTSKLTLTVTAIPGREHESILPGKFDRYYCYEISLTNDGFEIPLSDNVIIRFDNLPDDIVQTSARVFHVKNNVVTEYNRTPHAPFIGASTKSFGTYIVCANSNFTLKGDINGDGVIATYDAMIALYIVADLVDNMTPEQIKVADYDGNGKVETADALLILRKAADII